MVGFTAQAPPPLLLDMSVQQRLKANSFFAQWLLLSAALPLVEAANRLKECVILIGFTD